MPAETIQLRFSDGKTRRVSRVRPMRPKPLGAKAIPTRGSVGETKRDGSLTLLYLDRGAIAYANRRGTDKTHLYPELVDDEPRSIKARSAIIQGETYTGQGRLQDFESFLRRDLIKDQSEALRRARLYPLHFEAYDVLRVNGEWLVDQPLRKRKQVLTKLVPKGTKELSVAEYHPDTEAFVHRMRRTKGVEGVVLKDLDSPYRYGKQGAWLKLKFKKEADVVITGYLPGKGKRKDIGVLQMGVWKNGKIVPVGEVGTGYTDEELRVIKHRLDKGERLFAKVEYQRVGARGRLFGPAFKGLREDITVKGTHL